MKVIANKNDTKKRKRDETQDSVDESPKRAKVHAQRKFAQGASYNSPSITLIKDKVRPPANVIPPGLMLSAKRPNTEDFLTFLCFRRTSILPPKLDFFKDAFKEQPIPANYVQKTPASSTVHKNHTPENAVKLSAKRSERSESAKKTQTPVQALRRKYHEQRLAKQKPTNVTKLAQKVKGKNMIRTRSSTLQEEKPKAAKEVALLNDGKETLTGLRSGLQRTPPARSKLEKKCKGSTEMKNLRSRIKGKVVNSIVRSNPLPEKKSAKNSREGTTNKNEIAKNVKSSEISGKSKDIRVTTKRVEGLSDFSSDDNEPLLTVKKGKPVVKGKKMANGIKEVARTNSVKTRSQITEILPPTSHVAIRPTRKTKEAAALYMEMITKKLVSPEKSGDDDRSSVDSFPELPNAKRNEQRETEIKARAMAMKRGNPKENNTNVTDGKERGLRSSVIAVRKRELSRRSESSPAKSETLKKQPKENQSKKIVKEEQTKKNTREPTKKPPQKPPMTKRHGKEDSSKKVGDEPPKKMVKDEVRSRSLREDQLKKPVRDEKKTESAPREEIPKKTIKEETVKKGPQDDLPKRNPKEDSHKKNLRDETVKRGLQEEPPKKDGGKRIPEDDPAKKFVKDDISRKAGKEETMKKADIQSESAKRAVKEEPGKKAVKEETVKKQEPEDMTKKPVRDDCLRRDSANKSGKEDLSKRLAVNDEVNKKNVKEESIKEETVRNLSQDSGKKSVKEEIPKKTVKEDVTKKEAQEDAGFKTGKEEMPKKLDVAKKADDATKKTPNNSKKVLRDDPQRRQTKEDVTRNEEQAKDEEKANVLLDESVKEVGKEEVKKIGQEHESGKKEQKEETRKTVEVQDQPKKEDEGKMIMDDLAKKGDGQQEASEIRKEDPTQKKGSEEKKEQAVDEEKKELAKQTNEIAAKKQGKTSLKEDVRRVETASEESEARPSTRARKQEEHETKPKKAADRASGPKRPNSLPKKGCGTGSSTPGTSWLPPPGSDSNLVEAPTFYPTEKDFQDPLEFFERIRPAAESFGLCRIVPPSTFKPDCKVSDDMRFTAYNQYVHRMFHRWGPNIKEMMAIKKYLATQSISLKQPPWIGGIEVDLPRLYQSVQNCGGLMKVMEKKKWHQVADMMRIPKAAQDRVTKLDDIYCKYLLPYDTLSHDERQKLFDEVESDWLKRQESTNEGADEESEEESYIDECEECIVKGRNMALNQFYRIARNTMSMWFKTQEPAPSDVENEFWRHVSERTNHVCVHSGSIDSSGWGYGFPVAKNNTFSRHPWNLKVLTNNSGSVLRSLGPVMGVTVPTLHVGMVFTAFCWYRDPHGLPWVEYLHTGAPKIWYGISDDNSSVFRDALTKLLPRYIKNKKIWLPSDTAMVPPALLVEQGVSLCHTIQKPGQFILVFPRAFTSSICTGYLVSESVYFAQPSWLTTAEQVFRDIQDCCEPTMFSLEKLLFSIATDTRSSVEVLKQVLPMVWHIKQNEIDGRKTLLNLGLKVSERLPAPEQGGNKKRKGRWAQDEEGDYECEVCRTNLCVSLVINSQEEGVMCLPHAIELLTQKRHHLKYCKLMYSYTQEELCELVEKLEQRIESKSQKKVQSKSAPSVK